VKYGTNSHDVPGVDEHGKFEDDVPRRVEEPPEPSSSSAVPAIMKPLTEATITERDVLPAVAERKTQLEKQPNFTLIDFDTESFLDSGSLKTSADMLSEIYSAYTEPRFKTHECKMLCTQKLTVCVRVSRISRLEQQVWNRHPQL
jgi:hypothetical protein